MKTLKTLFIPSSPPSTTKSRPCDYCRKRFKPTGPAQLFCSVGCERKQEWVALSVEHARRLSSSSRASPPGNNDSLRRAVIKSAARHGTHPTPQAYASGGPSFNDDFGAHPPALARNHSMPERSRRRAGSHYTPKNPLPPLPIPSSPGHTPAHALKPLRLPDEQSSYRSDRSSPRSERRCRGAETDESDASSPTLWTSSPTSSSPTSVSHSHSHSPTAARPPRDTGACPLSALPPDALSRVGRHNKSASDLLYLTSPAPAPASAPASQHVFPVVAAEDRPMMTTTSTSNTNALGLAVKPFLVRTPSHPPSRANRKQTLDRDADALLVPKSIPGPPGPMPVVQVVPSAPARPHPRYRNGTLELRPGYANAAASGRRAPRPRSNSFGGFLKAPLF
ncbi:hypothetical protein L226DRAFT_568604 [Lentinus tigrinus ALCF2SS1-7]|uniref:Uncharacterized protein n=1 Tax=Lentinus tigrinus ALCF2SS1-6 TaxID=1328759 RepID=A0A5C2SHF7_9APHY|nr:hypothetical protein L227DRAFT_609253 [Lentinus tigrinus ALCF2SS1-6]RPD77550.1 hypothetical protein L226DRAFT_568604 [Lentinus tigrinus ALCF2SS1-7]